LYKWTVNWRFVDEETFLSPQWALGLLVGHLTVLCAFAWFRWCQPDGGTLNVLVRAWRRPLMPSGFVLVTPDCTCTFRASTTSYAFVLTSKQISRRFCSPRT
jgi:alpha-1,3-mannosyltransferase